MLPTRDYPLCSATEIMFFFIVINPLLTKLRFGGDGMILVLSLFLHVYGPQLGSQTRKEKKEQGQYPVIFTEQAWPINHM